MLCLCAAQLKFLFQTDLGRENSASCYRQGRQLLLTFLMKGHRGFLLEVQSHAGMFSPLAANPT